MNAKTPAVDYAAFRHEVEVFARSQCPPALRERVRANAKLHRNDYAAWQRILFAHGWAAPGWPVEFGGTGWDMRQRHLFEEVMAETDCPPQYHHGLGHIGPVLLHFGTPEQHARFVPGILNGTDWWCQGYSEPGAGSDLASLKTRAVRDGDHYVVTGQKVWTSHAHEADWMYTLVRTGNEIRKQDGISLLLIPLATPGIKISPIRTIDAWHHVNEVFLDEVRVPVSNRLGEEGKGWQCAKFLLDRERLAPALVTRLTRLLQQVEALIAGASGGARFNERLRRAEADVAAAREMLVSAIDEEMRGALRAAKSSALKLHCSELAQRIISIAFDALGPRRAARFVPIGADGVATPAEDAESNFIHNYLFYRSRTIAGGTSEVQKNVIARELFAGYRAATMFPGDLFDVATRFEAENAAMPTPQRWRGARELGWSSILVPDAQGGAGGTLADLAAVVEACGRHSSGLPVVTRAALVPSLLTAIGNDSSRAALKSIAAGDADIDFADGTALRVEPQADGGVRLFGRLEGVDDAVPATHRLFIAGEYLLLAPQTLMPAAIARHLGVDGARVADLAFNGETLPATAVLAAGASVARATTTAKDVACTLVAVEMTAAIGMLIEQTIAYLHTRKQFDVALATFQVLRHHVVDLYVQYESASVMMTRLVGDALHSGTVDARAASLAKFYLGDLARRTSEVAIQLHGGMGMTAELPAARLAMRLIAAEFEHGDRAYHLARIEQLGEA